MVTEPEPPDPNWPRYSTQPFPFYRFVPGRTPHPRRDHRGHSYGQPEPKPAPFPAALWQTSEDYFYGIDLYNFAYWWESHEVFEGLWHAVGHNTEQGNFFLALIQLAAANLKRFMRNEEAAQNLLQNSACRFSGLPDFYMGIDVAHLRSRLRPSLGQVQAHQLLLTLK